MEAVNTPETTQAKSARKPRNGGNKPTKGIIRKGVKRPLRQKPMEWLQERAGWYAKRIDKHQKTTERISAIHAKYVAEIEWKRKETPECEEPQSPNVE